MRKIVQGEIELFLTECRTGILKYEHLYIEDKKKAFRSAANFDGFI